MSNTSGGADETLPLSHEKIATLDADAVSICHDSEFVYAACRDNRVRVWAKRDWQLVATLGETSAPPLRVHVDAEQVYATCEKRVYVWSKSSWGMVGWFELTYQAITSTMYGDIFLVGAKDGRLVSINKATHETSSWQVYKSDVTSLWADESIICTAARKDECRVWKRENGSTPTEVAKLEKKGRVTCIGGSSEFVALGLSSGSVQLWDRVEWENIKTLEPRASHPVVSLWCNNHYLVAGLSQTFVIVYDLKSSSIIAIIRVENTKIEDIDVDHEMIYVGTPEGLVVVHMLLGGTSMDLESDVGIEFGATLLRTSPYDVLESVLIEKRKGDNLLQTGSYHEAVAAYENALQLLIDNTHALLEVPNEREALTDELNQRLGRALLHAKIQELQAIDKRIEQVSDEFDLRGRTEMDDEQLEKLWDEARRAIKESRVLAEAQAGDMLSYQLTFLADTLEEDLAAAIEKAQRYKEKVNQAKALVSALMAEWRWMERRRTTLAQRREFLETAIARLNEVLKETSDDDREVIEILQAAAKDFGRLRDQIARILSAADESEAQALRSRDEAIAAIDSLLKVMPKKRDAMLAIADSEERRREYQRLMKALLQALGTAKQFKLKEEARNIQNEIEALEGLNGTSTSDSAEVAGTAE
ncbi:MAG: hypothetical protein ACTSVD_00325 [Candidatus Thorarchaeota archaeon]